MSVQLELAPSGAHQMAPFIQKQNGIQWVGILHILNEHENIINADRTGYFPKITKNSRQEKQNWPSRKN